MQSDQSICLSLEYFMIVTLLTEHHFEFLSLKESCRGSSESTLVKMPHCHIQFIDHDSVSELLSLNIKLRYIWIL